MITCVDFLRDLKSYSDKPVFYFYGDEEFLLREAVENLQRLCIGAANDFNTSFFYGDDVEPAAVLDAVATISFGSKRRWVLVKCAGEFSAAQLQAFLPYLANPQSDAALVFVGGESADGRREFFKKLDKVGCLVKSERLKGQELVAWITTLAKRRGFQLENGAAELIEVLVGGSLFALDQAVERLALATGEDKVITGALVREALSDTHEGVIWSLTEALGKRDVSGTVRSLKRILRQKETASPLLVLGALAGYYRRLLSIALGLSLGQSDREISTATHLSPGALYFNKNEAKRWQPQQLYACLQLLSVADRELKSSGMPGELILSELLLQLLQVERMPRLQNRPGDQARNF